MAPPPRLAATVLAIIAAIALAAPSAAAKPSKQHGIPLPAGTRLDPDGERLRVPGSFRRAVQHVERYLRRQAIPHRAIPIYAFRGVVVARFLSDDPRSPWLAVHVYRDRGITYLAVVPRPAPLTSPDSQGK